METMKAYNRLKLDLNTNKATLLAFKDEQEEIIKYCGPKEVSAIDYSREKGSSKHYSNDFIFGRLIELSILIPTFENIVEILTKRLKEIEEEIKLYIDSSENDTETKVFYWRYIKGKPLLWVAKKLNYDYGYIRQIHSKIMRKLN